ncbi:MAG: DUF4124 domain-containing protein [Gammaproteobacteria bacterium]|nr:DUF4124 domain-containing protein [Gammaproteobacteria bacterium]
MIATLCVFSSTSNAAALYKWIDDEGQIRYSDRLPASQVKKKHQQLNSQGVVVTTKEAAKTEAELAAQAAAKLKLEQEKAEQAKLNAVQAEKDKVLLMTFSSEEELGLAHTDRIEVIESVIQLIEKSIVATQETLNQLETSAEKNYTSKEKEVPGGLAQKIEHFTRKIESRSEQLELKLLEKMKINGQYELDLARYRDLKAVEN